MPTLSATHGIDGQSCSPIVYCFRTAIAVLISWNRDPVVKTWASKTPSLAELG